MSKMDGLRAMREARYAEAAARAAKGTTSPNAAKRPAAAVRPETPARSVAQPAETAETETGLCGHRNMSGRTCTREHGHAAKSHRYS